MKEYHKIQTVYKRDPENKFKTLLIGEFAKPEFEYLANNEWIWTEKIDGTNIRVIYDGNSVVFNGKTDNAQIPSKLYLKLTELFNVEKMASVFDCPVCLYGEGYGAGIQKGGIYIPDGCNFILFDVFVDIWLKRPDVCDIANKLNIPVVPIIGSGSLYDAIKMVESGFASEVAPQQLTGRATAEGLVMRPMVEMSNRRGERIITKIKHKDF